LSASKQERGLWFLLAIIGFLAFLPLSISLARRKILPNDCTAQTSFLKDNQGYFYKVDLYLYIYIVNFVFANYVVVARRLSATAKKVLKRFSAISLFPHFSLY
jgi:hypothetical protein